MNVALAVARRNLKHAFKNPALLLPSILFPLLFVLFFLSSASLPRPFIETDWFRTIATWNPLSYLVEGLRSLVITGWDATALWRGFAVALVMAAACFGAANALLRNRMART